MNEYFPVAKISKRIKALPLAAHDDELEMEFRHREPSTLMSVITILVRPVEGPECVGSEDIEPDETEITKARQLLILRTQKIQAYVRICAKLHQEVTEEALEQPEDQQQYIANVLLQPPAPPVVTNIQCK